MAKLISNGTAISDIVSIGDPRNLPVSFSAPGATLVTLQYSVDGTVWNDFYQNDTLQTITPTNSFVTVMSPGLFRLNSSSVIDMYEHDKLHP